MATLGCMMFAIFSGHVNAVLDAILDDLERHPLTEEVPAPRDWNHLREILRSYAEDLILCTDVKAAIIKLRGNRSAQMAVKGIFDLLSDDGMDRAVERAYNSTPDEERLLPAYPFAAFLLDVCDNVDPATDFRDEKELGDELE